MYTTYLVLTYADAQSQSGGSCVKHCRREHSVNTHALNIVVDMCCSGVSIASVNELSNVIKNVKKK